MKKKKSFFDPKQKEEVFTICFSIFAILFLEGFAIYMGRDGVMFGSAMAAIGLLVGYLFGNKPKIKL